MKNIMILSIVGIFLSTPLIAEEGNVLVIIERSDPNGEFEPALGAIIAGDKHQLLQLEGDVVDVKKTVAKIKNAKLVSLYRSFRQGDLIFPILPKDKVIIFVKTVEQPANIDPAMLPNHFWSCKRLDGGLFIALSEASFPGGTVEVSGFCR